LDFIEKVILYNGSAVIIHKVNFFICSPGFYNSDTAAKQNLKLMMWGSRA